MTSGGDVAGRVVCKVVSVKVGLVGDPNRRRRRVRASDAGHDWPRHLSSHGALGSPPSQRRTNVHRGAFRVIFLYRQQHKYKQVSSSPRTHAHSHRPAGRIGSRPHRHPPRPAPDDRESHASTSDRSARLVPSCRPPHQIDRLRPYAFFAGDGRASSRRQLTMSDMDDDDMEDYGFGTRPGAYFVSLARRRARARPCARRRRRRGARR